MKSEPVAEAPRARKVHLLGYTNPGHMKFWRPFSCDSSSWASAMRFGMCDVYLGGGRFQSFKRHDMTLPLLERLAPRVRRYGIDPYSLTNRESWRGMESNAPRISAASWLDYSLDTARQTGTNLFLATPRREQVRMMLSVLDHLQAAYMSNEPGAAAPKARILVAFPYWTRDMERQLLERADDVMLLIDSGAFTAWKAGEAISLDDYCRFIEKLPIKPWGYFQLDVVGDADATVANYDEMSRRGFEPIPIFTRGAPVEHLDYFFSRTDFVGVGGLVGTRGNGGFVNGVMEHVQGKNVHLLGFKKAEQLHFWKPHSCDSSNWTRGQRFGRSDVYMGNGRIVPMTRYNIKDLLTDEFVARVARYGFDVFKMARDSQEWRNVKGSIGRQLGGFSWLDYSLDVARRFGSHIFLAAEPNNSEVIFDAFDRLAPLYSGA